MPSPNPTWKPGDKIESPVNEMVLFDSTTLDQPQMYKLLIGAVIPRPIAFVSTQSSAGVGNLSPFSFFMGISSKPPCIAISITRKSDGSKKDTLANIEETGEFVVNSANEWLAEPLVYSSGQFPYGVDEMQKVGLTPLPSVKIKPPRVMESAVQMECRLYNSIEIGDGSQGSSVLVIGEILAMHIAKQAFKDGKILHSELKPIARLGGFGYAKIGETFELTPPKV
ncbi:MAG: hypothetical protein DCC75_06880 [Proteobacteria bacterium]|nr:MAG: hypothetical protein DCC75_06880 [Pseudomonadota bacterium]